MLNSGSFVTGKLTLLREFCACKESLTLSAPRNKTNTFANSAVPGESASGSTLFVCHCFRDLQLSPFWQQRKCPNAEMEESVSGTQG